MSESQFKIDDRVKMSNRESSLGTVKEIRLEISRKSEELDNSSAMINVLWDNGTLSYHAQESLTAA